MVIWRSTKVAGRSSAGGTSGVVQSSNLGSEIDVSTFRSVCKTFQDVQRSVRCVLDILACSQIPILGAAAGALATSKSKICSRTPHKHGESHGPACPPSPRPRQMYLVPQRVQDLWLAVNMPLVAAVWQSHSQVFARVPAAAWSSGTHRELLGSSPAGCFW